MMLQGYIDESVSAKQRTFTLSALIGIGEEWERLSADWLRMIEEVNTTLSSQGRTPIRRYHASECNASSGNFKGWTREEQINLTSTILAVLKKYALKTVSYSIDLTSLRKTFPENDPLGSAYAITTLFMIHGLGKWLKDKGADDSTRLTLVHERSDYDVDIQARFNFLASDPEFPYASFFTTCISLGWEDCTPLQVADLFAYENMKEIDNRIDLMARRKTFDLILTQGQTGFLNYFIGVDAIENISRFSSWLDLPPKQR